VKIKLLLSCLALAVSANAQTGPKVVFVGDNLVYNWQQSAAFKANQNWVGQAVDNSDPLVSYQVAANFQTALNLHPDFVFISTGSTDVSVQTDSQPFGLEWEIAADAIIQMVQMAQNANVKVILGNIEAPGYNGSYFNSWIQTFATAKGVPVVNLNYWIQHGCAEVIPPPEPVTGATTCVVMQPSPDILNPVLTDLGYAFITQLTQSVIATYGLSIKSGYLGDMIVEQPLFYSIDSGYVYQVNSVQIGIGVQFTPQATYSDGVTRPMWNQPTDVFNSTATVGTWWSTNPKVMDVDQHGHAVAYTAGTANIWFKTASGATFAPWTMYVYEWYAGYGINPPVY
jgi:hypothetical protein